MQEEYTKMKSEMGDELTRLLTYWSISPLDAENGGFLGKIDHFNRPVPKASKGIILNSRILWSFAAASTLIENPKYQDLSRRSYAYLKKYFCDPVNKGVYWELDYLGQPINKRKQVYAQAFAIYSLSEYYISSKNLEAKSLAVGIFEQLEQKAKDHQYGGYMEALDENWSALEDMRLSDKDMNAAKTMNTHLHLLEAYTSLLRIHQSNELRQSLEELVQLFLTRFLNGANHYDLFFDREWHLLSNSISYGHDIETAWLTIEAAKALQDQALLAQCNKVAIRVADTFLQEGIDADGAVLNEKSLSTNELDTDRHWWPQVEALVGLKYAYELTKDEKYVAASITIWQFVKTHIIDHQNGEWHFRVDRNNKPYTQEDKVSMWKAPYHTSRACIIISTK